MKDLMANINVILNHTACATKQRDQIRDVQLQTIRKYLGDHITSKVTEVNRVELTWGGRAQYFWDQCDISLCER